MPPKEDDRSDLVLREYQPGDETKVLELFNRVFGSQAPDDFRVRSLDHWYWKFRDNPAGIIDLFLAFNGIGECVGQYAGVPNRFWMQGEQFFSSQSVDSVTDPRYRKGLQRPGLFVNLGYEYASTFGGRHRDIIMYGYPVPHHYRIGNKYLKYHLIRGINFLVKEHLLGYGAEPPNEEVTVEIVDRYGPEADQVWEKTKGELAAAHVRDAAYLNWRFADHPDIDYRLLLAKDAKTGEPRGLAALRDGGYAPEIVSLIEWLVPFEDHATEDMLLHRAYEMTRDIGKQLLVGWFPEATKQFERFQKTHDFYVNFTPYIQVVRPYDPGVSIEWLRENWYQTMGDMDLY
ncbi:MAG: GNAT family N-acetyltransferase [Planctomycetota bacterium]